MKHLILKALIAASIVPLQLAAIPLIHVRSQDRSLAKVLQKKMLSIVSQITRADAAQEGGPFGGFFDLAKTKYKDPILISATDGIGVKCSIAQTIPQHETIGFDLVTNCINSLVAQGAEPLFFLDYFATGKLNIEEGSQLLTGIAAACKASHCSLIGAETIEMPGIYQQGAYDVTGFAVGLVERDCVLPRSETIQEGDVLIGLATTGIHANGFSRIAKVIQDKNISTSGKPTFMSYHTTLAHALLEPSTLYVTSVLPLCRTNIVKAIAHSVDSLMDSLDAIIQTPLEARIDMNSWHIPPLFRWIKHVCGHDDLTMAHTYNLGIGMVLITASHDAQKCIDALQKSGMNATQIGTVSNHQTQPHGTLNGSIQSHVLRIMILGSGGAEHALAWKLAQSPYIGIVCVAPGNGGTSQEPKVKNIPLNLSHTNAIITYAQHNKIDLIIPGDICLGNDFVLACAQKGVRCIGPQKSAAALARSASTLQDFCSRHAIAFLPEPQTNAQRIIVGALTDGSTIVPFSSSVLYPYKLNGDKGDVTDGMGAYCPAPLISSALEQRILKEIFTPLLHGMQSDNMHATGFIYATIVLDHAKPHIASLNFGMNDPCAETMLMRLKTDLCLLCNAAYDGKLEKITIDWDPQSAVSTIVATTNYPASSKTGDVIAGIAHDDAAKTAKVFHNATIFKDGKYITNGGRVLCATALAKTRDLARDAAYALIKHVYWPDLHYRTDIAYNNQ